MLKAEPVPALAAPPVSPKPRAGRQPLPGDEAIAEAMKQAQAAYKADWDQGLPLLARSGDIGLKALAAAELAPAGRQTKGPKAVSLADGWWDAAESLHGRPKDNVLLHAGRWYRQALAEGDSALVRTRIEKRLDAVAAARKHFPAPPPASAPFNAAAARKHQQAWADYLGVSVVQTNSIGMKLVLIPPGEFEMGSTQEDIAQVAEESRGVASESFLELLAAEGPRHHVGISRAFYLGMYEVTQSEYFQAVGKKPSAFSATGREAGKVSGKDTSLYPVESVSWDEASDFCNLLSELASERAARRRYRLPTEAEWEYACRAGTAGHWGIPSPVADARRPATAQEPRKLDVSVLHDYAWVRENAEKAVHAVGQKKPNPWGLSDMHGNVLEWCLDRYDTKYYGSSPPLDPKGAEKGPWRVWRGGAWSSGPYHSRSAKRDGYSRMHHFPKTGFRVICEL